MVVTVIVYEHARRCHSGSIRCLAGANARLEPRQKHKETQVLVGDRRQPIVLPEQEKRLENPRAMQKGPKLALQLLGFDLSRPVNPTNHNIMQGRCHICPRNRDKKVRTRCISCQRSCCGEHSAVICQIWS